MRPYGLVKRILQRCRTSKSLGKPIKITVAPPKNHKAERVQPIVVED